jgi:CBS domain-containing protein
MSMGFPTEGENAAVPRAGDVARADVPTCRLGERMSDVRARVRDAGWDACVVTNEQSIVLGLLRRAELEAAADDAIAEHAMRPGPSTFRPFVSILEMAEHMVEHDLESSPVTTGDGRLVGLLLKADAAEVALTLHRHEHGSES